MRPPEAQLEVAPPGPYSPPPPMGELNVMRFSLVLNRPSRAASRRGALALAAASTLLGACGTESTAENVGGGDVVAIAPDTAGIPRVSVKQTIDEAGGRVEAVGATVIVPAGALASAVEIAVGPTDGPVTAVPPEFDSAGDATSFTPHGTTFTVPVTLELAFSGDAGIVLRLADESDGTWEVVEGARFEDGVAIIEVSSFSVYVPVACSLGATPKGGTCLPPVSADCSKPPLASVPAGQVVCYGGQMNENACEVFGAPPQWNWAGNGECVTGGPAKDASAAAYLQNKHRGDGSGSTIYNLGVCCIYEPATPVIAACSNPPPVAVPAGQVACHGGHMDEAHCTTFGSPPDWNWAGNGQCVTGGAAKDPSAAAYLENKHRGDGSGSSVYNLGVCCTYAPATPVIAACTTPPPVAVPAGQVACHGGHMDEAHCATFGLKK